MLGPMLIRSRAPLRLGLAGGGTDVSPYCNLFGGAVLNASVDLYAHATLEYSTDGAIHFEASDQQITEDFLLSSSLPLTRSLALHAGVYNRIVHDFNAEVPLPVRMTTRCDAPAGSGLGSSSTLVVAMVQAYIELLNLPLGEYEIAQLAYSIERGDVGLKGGRQDQYAASFGGFNFMEFNKEHVLVNPLRIKDWIISELESSLVLYFTGRSRESAAIIVEESKNVEQGNIKAIEAMHRTKQEAFRMKESLLRGEIAKMAEIMESAWAAKKEMARSISNERIESFYSIARSAGARCGKVSGAGGGGFMMFLVDPVRRLDVLRALESADGDGMIINCHFSQKGSEAWRIE